MIVMTCIEVTKNDAKAYRQSCLLITVITNLRLKFHRDRNAVSTYIFFVVARKSRIICSVSPRYAARHAQHARPTLKISHRWYKLHSSVKTYRRCSYLHYWSSKVEIESRREIRSVTEPMGRWPLAFQKYSDIDLES